ncbi:helix-turn-helix domain-containing protein [Curvivirga sp.]|uniref:helix-turn-helix domain-containing protein n=1 Tax=Curvivirga sp. TaxID=2856848 RepID=UPI003B5C8130
MNEDWMTVKEAAKRAGVCTKTIYRAIASGKLRAVRLGGTMIRIDPLHFLDYVHGGRGES